MLSSSQWLVCLWLSNVIAVVRSQGNESEVLNCTIESGQLPEVQGGENNYVIDLLGDIPFSFALNQCTSIDVPNNDKWYKYVCDMDSNTQIRTVTKTEYPEETCAGEGVVMQVFSENNVTDGMRGYFDCNGSDTYVELHFSLNDQCGNFVTVYGALDACFHFTEGLSEMNLYCDDVEAVAQIFTSLPTNGTSSTFGPSSTSVPGTTNLINTSSIFNQTLVDNETISPTAASMVVETQRMCSDSAFCDQWLFPKEECDFVATIALHKNNKTRVYGQMVTCFTDVSASSMPPINSTMLPTNSTMLATNFTLPTNISLNATGEPTDIGVTDTVSTKDTSAGTGGETETDSIAIRPSFFFTTGMFFCSFFFLLSI